MGPTDVFMLSSYQQIKHKSFPIFFWELLFYGFLIACNKTVVILYLAIMKWTMFFSNKLHKIQNFCFPYFSECDCHC